jgi:hypothetical protein
MIAADARTHRTAECIWCLPRRIVCAIGVVVVLAAGGLVMVTAQSLPYDVMAERIALTGKLTKGERVLLRVHKETMPDLAPVVQKRLERDGAIVEILPYGPAPDLAERLQRTDVYVWLPAPASATPPDQGAILAKWIDRGGGVSCTSTGPTARDW